MKKFSILSILMFQCFLVFSQILVSDSTFNTTDVGFGNGDGFFGIEKIIVQPDGKILAPGSKSFNGVKTNWFCRLNNDLTIDTAFQNNLGAGFAGGVLGCIIQPDGKIIVTGNYDTLNGQETRCIVRLNGDGTRDASFNIGTGFYAGDDIYDIALQPDGKIIVVGDLMYYNTNNLVGRIVRLNSDGTLDNSFNNQLGVNEDIRTIALQADGKILIGGRFTIVGGINYKGIARLNSDGSIDNTFQPGSGFNIVNNLSVNVIRVQTDGKILVGGRFTTYQGTSANRLVRLNQNGSRDNSFNIGTGFNGEVKAIYIQPDERVVLGGFFTTYKDSTRNSIVRLNTDASVDTTFACGSAFNSAIVWITAAQSGKLFVTGGAGSYNDTVTTNLLTIIEPDGSIDNSRFYPGTGFNDFVNTMALQSDGKIVVGGEFTYYNGIEQNRITRLNIDGSRDNSFHVGRGFDKSEWQSEVRKLAVQPDGKILVVGYFYDYDSFSCNRIARLNPDGSFDTTFNSSLSGAQILSIVPLPNGKILVGGEFTSLAGASVNRIARLNADGTIDNSFNLGTGFNNIVYYITIQSDGKILVGGDFSNYNGTATGKIVRLLPDGILDNTLNASGEFNGNVYSILQQPDNKILIAGTHSVFTSQVVRLNPDGTKDTGFDNAATFMNGTINDMVLLSDGKLFVGGSFIQYAPISNYVIYNEDGSFNSFLNMGDFEFTDLKSVLVQPDGKILIGGYFTSYNGEGRNRIARLIENSLITDREEKLTEHILSIYPNPTNNIFAVNFNEPTAISSSISLINSLGQEIKNEIIPAGTSSYQMNISGLPDGIYWVRSLVSNEIYTAKVVKQ